MDESGKLFAKLRWLLICCKLLWKIQWKKFTTKESSPIPNELNISENEIESDFENCKLWKAVTAKRKIKAIAALEKKNQFSEPSWVFKYVAVIDCDARKSNAGVIRVESIWSNIAYVFFDLDFQQCHVVISQSTVNLKPPRIDKNKVHRKFSKQC